MRTLALRSALILAALLLAGCGDDPAPAAARAAKKAAAAAPVAAAAPAAAEPAPTVSTFQYAYNPLGKRDPFRAWEDENKGPGEGAAQACLEPLCLFDLEALTLVAVVSGDANPLGMVEDPQGVGHIIRRNTRIGKQGGKVTQVLRDCVIVTEFWTGPDGKSNPNPVRVCVKVDKKDVPPLDLMNPQRQY